MKQDDLDRLFEANALDEIRVGAQIALNAFAGEFRLPPQHLTVVMVQNVLGAALRLGYLTES